MGRKLVIRTWAVLLLLLTFFIYFSDWELVELDNFGLGNEDSLRDKFGGRIENCNQEVAESTNSSFGNNNFDVFALAKRTDVVGHLLEDSESKIVLLNRDHCDKGRFMIVSQRIDIETLKELESNFADWCILTSAKGQSNTEFLLRASIFAIMKNAQFVWIIKNLSPIDFHTMDRYSNLYINDDWVNVIMESKRGTIQFSQSITIPLSSVSLIQFEKRTKSGKLDVKAGFLSDWSSTGFESSVLYTKNGFFLLAKELLSTCNQVSLSQVFASQVSKHSKMKVISVPLTTQSDKDKEKAVSSVPVLREELKRLQLNDVNYLPRFEEALAYATAVNYIDEKSLEVVKIWIKIFHAFRLPLNDEQSKMDTCTRSSKFMNQLDLFLPIGPSSKEFHDWFIPSFQTFWPKPLANLVLMLDEERGDKHRVPHTLLGGLDSSWISYIGWNSPKFQTYYNKKGYDRQQFLMFWADNFTTSEYIGFVDDDTVFLSRILESDLFDEDGKPIVFGFIGEYEDQTWKRRSKGSVFALQMPETMRCMSHFPVVVHREDLAALREYIAQVHSSNNGRQTSFNDIFKTMSAPKGYYSQFNIMCTYLWNFKNEKYAWKLQKSNVFKEGVNKNITFEILMDNRVTQDMLVPKARIATHFTYQLYGKVYEFEEAMNVAKCYSSGRTTSTDGIALESQESDCAHVNTTEPFDLQWRFEGQNWLWDPRVSQEHAKRMQLLKQCSILETD